MRATLKYGLYTYNDWKNYIDQNIFEIFNFQYFKIPIGKKFVTKQKIISYINLFNSFNNKGEV